MIKTNTGEINSSTPLPPPYRFAGRINPNHLVTLPLFHPLPPHLFLSSPLPFVSILYIILQGRVARPPPKYIQASDCRAFLFVVPVLLLLPSHVRSHVRRSSEIGMFCFLFKWNAIRLCLGGWVSSHSLSVLPSTFFYLNTRGDWKRERYRPNKTKKHFLFSNKSYLISKLIEGVGGTGGQGDNNKR